MLLPPGFDIRIDGSVEGRIAALTSLATPAKDGLAYCSLAGDRIRKNPIDAPHAVFCTPENAESVPAPTRFLTPDPRAAFIRLAEYFAASDAVDYTAMMRRAAEIEPGSAEVHETAIIEKDVCLGDGVRIGPGVVVHRGTVIGPRTEIRSGTVIGEAGIAMHRQRDGGTLSQPHLGLTIIGQDCVIGANAVVMRAMLDETRIGSRATIGNLCNIGHGVSVGEKVWMSVGCMIGGHAVLEDGVTLGMGVQIRDNITLGTGTQVGMGSVVLRNASAGAHLFGSPAKPIRGRLVAGPDR